jgi:hypothetical protein
MMMSHQASSRDAAFLRTIAQLTAFICVIVAAIRSWPGDPEVEERTYARSLGPHPMMTPSSISLEAKVLAWL